MVPFIIIYLNAKMAAFFFTCKVTQFVFVTDDTYVDRVHLQYVQQVRLPRVGHNFIHVAYCSELCVPLYNSLYRFILMHSIVCRVYL